MRQASKADTLIAGSNTDISSAQTNISAGPEAETLIQQEEPQPGKPAPLSPLVQAALAGNISIAPVTPPAGYVPTLPGTPQVNGSATIQGTPQAPGQPIQSGSVPHALPAHGSSGTSQPGAAYIHAEQPGFDTFKGPSSITEQPTTGGQENAIYTDQNNAIQDIATIDAHNLLLFIGNVQGDTGQNGIWKLNLVTGQKIRLMTPPAQNGEMGFNYQSFSPWDNVSRDGNMYALNFHIYDNSTSNIILTSTLFIGSLGGNSASTKIYTSTHTYSSTAYADQVYGAYLVGWTTM